MKKHIKWLRALGACRQAVEWADQYDTIAEVWEACKYRPTHGPVMANSWRDWLLTELNARELISNDKFLKWSEETLSTFDDDDETTKWEGIDYKYFLTMKCYGYTKLMKSLK